MRLSRRDVLNRAGFGMVLGMAVARNPQSLLSHLLFEPDAPLVAPRPLPDNRFLQGDHALVAVVHGRDVGAMIAEGLGLLGGADRLKLQGKRVVIKPNVLNDRPPPTTTNPAVVEALARMASAAGATSVVVADGSGMIRLPTKDNLLATGMAAAAERTGAQVLAIEDERWVRVEPPQATVMQRYLVSRPVYEAEVLINVPVVKTHRFAEYSCGLKNMVGIVHPRHRPSLSFLSGQWHERIAELNLAVHPHLNVADATTIMIAGGPTSGTPATPNLLLFSGDRVALDVVAVALLRSYGASPKLLEKGVWEQRQIHRAGELGLGITNPQRLRIVGRSLEPRNEEWAQVLSRLRQDVGAEVG